MDTKLLASLCVVFLILIFALFSYSLLSAVEISEVSDQVRLRNQTAHSTGRAEVHPEAQRRVHIYSSPHYVNLMHTALENNLPLLYDFGASSSLFTVGNHVAYGTPEQLGSIDAGELHIKISMIAPDGTLIETRKMTGGQDYIFGRSGLFDDYVRFGVRGGKMQIQKI